MVRHALRLAAELGAVLVLQPPSSMLDVVVSMLDTPGCWPSSAKPPTCFSTCSTKPWMWRSHCLH